MTTSAGTVEKEATFLTQHPALTYLVLTFSISWLGALAVAAPHLLRSEPLTKLTGVLMFPAMLLGPPIASIVLTGIGDGRAGLRDLAAHLFRWRIPAPWHAVLLLPPILVLCLLCCLQTFASPSYAPNRFLLGVLFGFPAGIFEEIGWTGYAFPKLVLRLNALAASVLLGMFWALWHLPVVDYLGAATPHGTYWFPFFLAFAAAMTAMRVLISCTYANTDSLLLAQLLHISSTGSLVIFSPPQVTARQEVIWYFLYATLLWAIVAAVVKIFGARLTRPAAPESPSTP